MALVKCSECGHEVSDNALSCPNCGYILKKTASNSGNTSQLDKVSEIIEKDQKMKNIGDLFAAIFCVIFSIVFFALTGTKEATEFEQIKTFLIISGTILAFVGTVSLFYSIFRISNR